MERNIAEVTGVRIIESYNGQNRRKQNERAAALAHHRGPQTFPRAQPNDIGRRGAEGDTQSDFTRTSRDAVGDDTATPMAASSGAIRVAPNKPRATYSPAGGAGVLTICQANARYSSDAVLVGLELPGAAASQV